MPATSYCIADDISLAIGLAKSCHRQLTKMPRNHNRLICGPEVFLTTKKTRRPTRLQ